MMFSTSIFNRLSLQMKAMSIRLAGGRYAIRGVSRMGMTLALFLFLIPAVAGNAWAVSNYTTSFNSTYGTSGARGLNTLGSCITCHPGALNGSSTLNSYSSDWLAASHNFAAIESLDSDRDGYDNLTEIQAGTFPGDISSVPSAPVGVAPVANAGVDQVVAGSTIVTLDGSRSSDSDGTISTYSWRQTAGPVVALSNAAAAKPQFTAPSATSSAQTLTFQLTVVDNSGMESNDTCIVTVSAANSPPVANAGADQNVNPGDNVVLNGSGSTDADGQIASYSWVQTAGSTVALSNASSAQASFSAPNAGPSGATLTFRLTVTDNVGAQATAICIVNVLGDNQPPTADAGVDQSAVPGVTIMLDGSGSTDADGTIVTYLWEQTGGTAVVLSDATSVQPTFIAPDGGSVGVALTFKLTVTDDMGTLASDSCIVNVLGQNQPPLAAAGGDANGGISYLEGETVTLDGTGSYDPDGVIVSYQWEQIGGAATVTLSDPSAAQPTFITPIVDAQGLVLTFQLTVTDDGGLAASDEVAVTIADNGMTDFPTDVLSIPTDAGMPIGLAAVSGGAVTQISSSQQGQNPSYQGSSIDLHFGLLDIAAKPAEPGGSVTMTIYFSEPAVDGASWYKFNSSAGTWSDYSQVTDANGHIGAVFNDTRDQVTLTLVDGGIGDDDGTVNGVIVDPSGLGALVPADSAPAADPNGYAGQASNDFGSSGGCFISTMIGGIQ